MRSMTDEGAVQDEARSGVRGKSASFALAASEPLIRPASPATFPRKGGEGSATLALH
jgi:hypothetical protein